MDDGRLRLQCEQHRHGFGVEIDNSLGVLAELFEAPRGCHVVDGGSRTIATHARENFAEEDATTDRKVEGSVIPKGKGEGSSSARKSFAGHK